MTMRTLGSLMPSSLKKHGLGKQVILAQMLIFLREELALLLKDPTNQIAQPLYCKRNIITIKCTHSAVAQEIKFNEQNILQKINGTFPGMNIKSVHLIC